MSTKGPKCWKCGKVKENCNCTFIDKVKKKSPGRSKAKPKADKE